MKSYIILFLFSLAFSQSLKELFRKHKDFKPLAASILKTGAMDGYLDYNDFKNITSQLAADFGDILKIETLTTTQGGQIIPVFKLESNPTNKAVLFTGMHHAREPASFNMNLYILFYILHRIEHGYQAMNDLLATVNVYFIPMINVDGFIQNNKMYMKEGNFNNAKVRKNFRNGTEFEDCRSRSYGVDLNRNYGYKWGYDNEGSSDDVCADSYRGPSAFSEKETSGIRDFIDKHSNIKIAYNYHAYGNMMIMPFSFVDDYEKEFMNGFRDEYEAYKAILADSGLPRDVLYGNAMETVGYSGNGEASDWMLAEKRIIAFSPELGTNNDRTRTFYTGVDLMVDSVLPQNLKPAIYALQKASYLLKYGIVSNTYTKCRVDIENKVKEVQFCNEHIRVYSSVVSLKNTGFTKHTGSFIPEAKFNNDIIEGAIITILRGNYILSVKIVEKEELNKVVFAPIDDVDDITIKVNMYINEKKETGRNAEVLFMFKKETDWNVLVYNNPVIYQEFRGFKETSGNSNYLYQFTQEIVTDYNLPLIGFIVVVSIIPIGVMLYLIRRKYRSNNQSAMSYRLTI
jgi:hypothetical protein